MAAYAEPNDVAAELGRPPFTDSVQIAQVQAWLTRVDALIRSRIPDLDDRVTSGELDAAVVRNVEAAVVARKVLNPEGLSTTTVSVDDGSVTKTRPGDRARGGLWLTEDEWSLLMPAAGAFSIRRSGSGPDAFYNDTWPLRPRTDW